MKVLAKFIVSKVSELGYGGQRQEIMRATTPDGRNWESTGIPVREITLQAVHDDGLDKENASFAKATPSGQITFQLNNPACADEFKVGNTYYVEFTRKD